MVDNIHELPQLPIEPGAPVQDPTAAELEHSPTAEVDPMILLARRAISECIVPPTVEVRLASLVAVAFGEPFIDTDTLTAFTRALRQEGLVKTCKGIYGVIEGTGTTPDGDTSIPNGNPEPQARERRRSATSDLDLNNLIEKVVLKLNRRPGITDKNILGAAKSELGHFLPPGIADALVVGVITHKHVHSSVDGTFRVAIPRNQLPPHEIDPQAEFIDRTRVYSSFDAMIKASKVGKGPKRKQYTRKNGGRGKKTTIMEGDSFLVE